MLATLALAAAVTVALSLAVLLCLKIKSSKKDPAFVGLEGTISPLGEAGKDRGDGGDRTPTHPSPRTPMAALAATGDSLRPPGHIRTPSRSGERKLPDIPKNDDGSELYATLDGGSDSEDGGAGNKLAAAEGAGSVPSLPAKREHPYAKVKKKKKGGVEHPYATVKKVGPPPSPGGNAPPIPAKPESQSTTEDEEEDEDEDDDRLLLHPSGRGSRPGSDRARGHLDTSHASGGSRQTTPLPPEPPPSHPAPAAAAQPATAPAIAAAAAAPPPPAGNHMQNPNMHFSGDSQDSSKGYTSITVREPARHIHLPRQVLAQDATYATVSETSDDMYAAIEDPTYVPTGTSQSNSDTYAIIDLPEEAEVDFNPSGAAAAGGVPARLPSAPVARPEDLSPESYTYSRVDKSKKRAAPAIPVSSGPNRSRPASGSYAVRRSLDALGVEDMYAKVQKRSSAGAATAAAMEEDNDFDLPVGASAMNPSASTGARPKVRSSLDQARMFSQQHRTTGSNRSEINYSDFEVALYDRGEKRKESDGAGAPKRPSNRAEAGYETIPGERREEGRLLADGGYEVLPESDWKMRPFNNGGGSNGGGNRPAAPPSEESGYEHVPDYWRSTNSGGYETVTDAAGMVAAVGASAGRDPEYEMVRDRPLNNNDYDVIDGKARGEKVDHGYERVARPQEPPYNRLDGEEDEEELGYETIVGRGGGARAPGRQPSDYDPNYEVLSQEQRRQGSEPGYETVKEGLHRPDYDQVPEDRGRRPLPPDYETVSDVRRQQQQQQQRHHQHQLQQRPGADTKSVIGAVAAAASPSGRVLSDLPPVPSPHLVNSGGQPPLHRSSASSSVAQVLDGEGPVAEVNTHIYV